jgi:hypothetical protein
LTDIDKLLNAYGRLCTLNLLLMLFDKILNTTFSFGAAVVVFGAWAKLEHKAYSDSALTLGMLTEVGIFFLYGLLEWRRRAGLEQKPGPAPANLIRMEELTKTLEEIKRILTLIFRVR